MITNNLTTETVFADLAINEEPTTYRSLAFLRLGVADEKTKERVRYHVRKLIESDLVERVGTNDRGEGMFKASVVRNPTMGQIINYLSVFGPCSYSGLAMGIYGNDDDAARERVRYHVRSLRNADIVSRTETDNGVVFSLGI